ncbi:hypothetical protein [Microcoleus sp. BROC3]
MHGERSPLTAHTKQRDDSTSCAIAPHASKAIASNQCSNYIMIGLAIELG